MFIFDLIIWLGLNLICVYMFVRKEVQKYLIRGFIFGSCSVLLSSAFYSKREMSANEMGLFLGTYMFVVSPYSYLVKQVRDRVCEKLVFEEFRVLYQDKPFVLNNYFFNKRAMGVDFFINFMVANISCFYLLRFSYSCFFGKNENEYRPQILSLAFNTFAIYVINDFLFGFLYSESKKVSKFYGIFAFLIKVRFQAQILGWIVEKDQK